MLIAALTITPSRAALLHALQSIADSIVAINERWLRDQMQRGAKPPVALAHARAPWAPEGVRYVPHHGDDVGVSRIYQDGLTAMTTGSATCFDAACYDAPASTLLLGVPMRVVVLPTEVQRAGQPLRCHAWLVNEKGERIDPVAAFRKEGQ